MPHAPTLNRDFFSQDAVACARQMIGCHLLWRGSGGVIVETEAYRAENDPACHTFLRPSTRQFIADHTAGTAYVYLNYGVHWLLNVLTKEGDNFGFVLLRAIRPTAGLQQMKQRRRQEIDTNLCSGPGKLTQALAINGETHGQPFLSADCRLSLAQQTTTTWADGRIGISRAQDFPWRFTSAADQAWVSRKFKELPKAKR